MIKKIFIGIVAFTLCVNLTAFATSLFPIGDVTLDGTVNSLDAAQVLKHDAKLISLEGAKLACADYNEDGVVNSLDASGILRYDAGLTALKTVINIVDDSYGKGLDDALEFFYEDDDYHYYFPCIMSRYITVHYSDGTSENVKNAFVTGIVTIADLDSYDIDYIRAERCFNASEVTNIVDDSYGKGVGEAIQYFYEDDTYAYLFTCWKGDYITVYYSNGTSEDLITAFENGRVTVEDLDRFGIHYEKEHRFYSYGANRFDWSAVMEGTHRGAANELERITEGFVNTQPIDTPLPEINSLEAAEERAKAEYPDEYRHVVFSYDDAKEVFCVAFYETPYDTSPYQCVYMDKVGVTLLITKCIPYPDRV
ncbi:MAG: hypothetical protein E7597_01275 [Ruminococcaceae bacterium]|nr:hypothetical protein [Oscillospiraceae bacterium]